MFTTDTTYWKVWGNTFLFALGKIPIELTLAMFLALLLNKKLKGVNFFRTMYYMPNIISVVIIGLIFSNMFSYWGIINTWLVKLGVIDTEIDWFAEKLTAMAVLIIGSIWNTFGINVMYFLAALSNVPEELYECARLDGASKFQTFFKVTLPMIGPVFQVIILLSIIGTLSVNEYIIVLTNGGPAGQTLTVMSYLTKQFVPGFTDATTPALGYGCAMSLITTIIFAIIAIVYNKFSKRMGAVY
jgi:raffinose/stachyose/melibiose transport system permease protein